MGFLDDTLNKALPQGSSVAKPMLAFLALLASGALSRKQAPAAAPDTRPPPGTNADPGAGGLLGGLGGLLGQLQQGGLGEVVKSWVDTGENKPISPSSLDKCWTERRTSFGTISPVTITGLTYSNCT